MILKTSNISSLGNRLHKITVLVKTFTPSLIHKQIKAVENAIYKVL